MRGTGRPERLRLAQLRAIGPAQNERRSDRALGITLTVLLHAAAVAALLQYQPIRSALTEAAPIMVSLIVPAPVVEKPKERPKPLPVKHNVQPPPPLEPAPVITSTAPEIPTQPAAPPPPPQPQTPPVAAAPAPGPVTAPPPVVPPSFSAAYLENPPPRYPAMARRLGEQGRVMLRVLVSAAGLADKVELRTSSGSERLDEAAIETVKRWRFVPARQGERSVAAWVLIPINFTLEG